MYLQFCENNQNCLKSRTFIAEKHFKDLHLLLCYMKSCMCILCLNMRKSNSVERFSRVLTVGEEEEKKYR